MTRVRVLEAEDRELLYTELKLDYNLTLTLHVIRKALIRFQPTVAMEIKVYHGIA